MTQADKYISFPVSPNVFTHQFPYELSAAISMDASQQSPHHLQNLVYPLDHQFRQMVIKKEPVKNQSEASQQQQQHHHHQHQQQQQQQQQQQRQFAPEQHIMPSPYTMPPLPHPATRITGTSATLLQSRPHNRSGRAKFKCHLCPSTFSRKDNLKTHHRLHSGEMPFQCQYCGRKFRWQSSARTHESVHERHGHRRLNSPPNPTASTSTKPRVRPSPTPTASVAASTAIPTSLPAPSATVIARPLAPQNAPPMPPADPAANREDFNASLSRRHRVRPEIQTRSIQKKRVPQNLVFDLDGIFGEVGPIGGALQAEVQTEANTPQIQGDSPMFSLPKLSQQDLERCLEEKPDAM